MRLLANIIGFIGYLTRRIVWNICLFSLFLIGFLYVTGEFYRVEDTLHTVAIHVDAFLSHRGWNTDLDAHLDKWTGIKTDHSKRATSASRWERPFAKIYIDTTEKTFQLAYEVAIQHWNQTGAFYFITTDDINQADIIATEMDDGSIAAAGESESQIDVLNNYFMCVTVRLNRYYLLSHQYTYEFDRIVNTAEHELGHAIGLDHNEDISVMQPAGSYYSIQEVDIENVEQLYAS